MVVLGLALVIAIAIDLWRAARPAGALGDDPRAVDRGEAIYAAHCTRCHGQQLEGQADWQSPRADGKMPAPPHNSDGHTWHHDTATLVGITKHGLVPLWAPKGYRSGMPAFAGVLSEEEIRAVLSFIASTWNEEARSRQQQIEAQVRAR